MPDFYLFRIVLRVAALLAAASVLSACGQRGPLYLPKPEDVSAPAKPAAAASDAASSTPASK